eukprot:COSAG01_NODE_10618_length_2120_cov_12.414646_3_plen_58_part_00
MNGGVFPGDQGVYNPEPPVNGDKLFVSLGQRRGRPRLRCPPPAIQTIQHANKNGIID